MLYIHLIVLLCWSAIHEDRGWYLLLILWAVRYAYCRLSEPSCLLLSHGWIAPSLLTQTDKQTRTLDCCSRLLPLHVCVCVHGLLTSSRSWSCDSVSHPYREHIACICLAEWTKLCLLNTRCRCMLSQLLLTCEHVTGHSLWHIWPRSTLKIGQCHQYLTGWRLWFIQHNEPRLSLHPNISRNVWLLGTIKQYLLTLTNNS